MMLKKIFICLTVGFFSLIAYSLSVQGATWFYLFDGSEGMHYYWSPDDYAYDPVQDLASCSYRLVNDLEGEEYQVTSLFNLKKKKAAIRSLRVYKKGQLVLEEKPTQLEYRRVRQGSNGDYLLALLSLTKELTQEGIAWEFNATQVPPPSQLSSSNWLGGDNSINAYVDQSSKYINEREKGGWIKMGNTVQWYRFDLVKKRAAICAQEVYKQGQLLASFNYPLIIWSDIGNAYSEKAQRLFLKQSVICFRMQKGVRLDR